MRSAVLLGFLMLGGALAGCADSSEPGDEAGLETGDGSIPKFSGLPTLENAAIFGAEYEAEDFPRVVEVLVGARGAEPNMGVTSKGGIFLTGYDSTMRSLDGGHAWERVYEFQAAEGVPVDPFNTYDPMLWVDPDTDRVFTNHNYPIATCSSTIISDDNGESWTHFPLTCGLPGVDHQKLATGRNRGPVASPLYENVVYFCYNKVASTNCAMSLDGGMRYEYETVVALATECGGINGHPTAAPDGTLYVPMGEGCGVPHVGVTKDNGVTWTVRSFGESTGSTYFDPEVAVTPDGTAYYFNRGEDGGVYLFRSKDEFATVDGPFKVNPDDVKGTIFAVLGSGDDGRLAMAYLGNREYAGDPSEAPDNTTWHLFVTYTSNAADANPTFATHQVTPPNDPVQIGCIWLRGLANPCRNLLDFIDGFVDQDGRFYVVFTDGCTRALSCAYNPKASPSESRDRALALAVQDHGPSLLKAGGLLPSLGWTQQINEPPEP